MAIQRSDKIKAALFLTVTVVLFGSLIITLVGTQWLRKKDRYYIQFDEAVKGLKPGSLVRYHGEEVGKVRGMKFDPESAQTRVTIEVNPHTLIKEDSIATIEIDSYIIGNKSIMITPGRADSPLLPPNDPRYLVRSGRSGFQKFSSQIVDISAQMGGLIENVSGVFSPQNAQSVSSILCYIDEFMASNSTLFADTLIQFRGTLVRLDEAIVSANDMMDQNQRNIAETVGNLRVATDMLNELLDKINRQPAVLLRGSKQEKEPWSDE